jgi:transporter family-2 protein
VAVAVSPFLARPEFTARAVGYAAATGVLVAVALGCIALSSAQIGVARTFSLVIGTQLIVGLVLDALGLFGAGADLGVFKVLGVVLILTGSVLVVRF